MTGELVHFPRTSSFSASEGRDAAARALQLSCSDRRARRIELHLHESETLLAVCRILDERMESCPASVGDDAKCFYEILESSLESSLTCLFDEREYYLGELAYLAGGACRFMGQREQARTWFDRAEAWFLLTTNSSADLARVLYQRLGLTMEERRYSEVLHLVTPLIESFARAGSGESVLKCRFLQANAYREMEMIDEALRVYSEIAAQAQKTSDDRLWSLALVGMVQIYSDNGNSEEAIRMSQEVAPVLARMKNKVGLAKLRWGIANLLRRQGNAAQAVETFRLARNDFAEIEMRGDAAALSLIIADLLLECGQEAQAEWEIRAALPVIDELKMVPEGVAALSLLRESVRRRKIDRQALRDLHGYFDEIQG